jgi:hypothetical protein
MPQQDFRARLQPKNINSAEDILGNRLDVNNLLRPLYSTNGVLFPYTPSVSTGNAAEYDPTSFIHSDFGYNAYVRSYPKPISINAEFTAQTNDEALYLLSVIHFFRSVTKMYFGINPYKKAGTPPPVLLFNYLGDYMFNNVPVVVKSFDMTLEANVDYIPVYTGKGTFFSRPSFGVSLPPGSSNGYSYVPTHLNVTVDLDTQYTPITIRNEFNLDEFRAGRLINKGYI